MSDVTTRTVPTDIEIAQAATVRPQTSGLALRR